MRVTKLLLICGIFLPAGLMSQPGPSPYASALPVTALPSTCTPGGVPNIVSLTSGGSQGLYTCTAPNTWTWTSGAGGGTPGGASGTVQFNNAAAFGGIANWTTNGTNSLTSGAVAFGNNGINFLNAGPTSWTPGGSRPYPYWAGYFININTFPSTSLNTLVQRGSALTSAIRVPAASTVVGSGLDSYGISLTASSAALGAYSVGLSGAANQMVWGHNANVNDCDHNICTDSGTSNFAANSLTGYESDSAALNSGTLNVVNFLANNRPTALYQASTSDIGFYNGKSANGIGSVTFTGSGTNAVTIANGAQYTGNINTTYCVQIASATTFNWSYFANSSCQTGTDLVIGAANSVSGTSHFFTNGDVSGNTRLQILSGTGCTAATYSISSVNDATGVATLGSSPGTVASTCTYVLWEATGVAAASTTELVMPADSTTTRPPNVLGYGQAIRGTATSYGVNLAWSATSGLTTNDYWTFAVTGVPPKHYGFGLASGSADYALNIPPIHGGTSQSSMSILMSAVGSSGITRTASISNSNVTGGSILTFNVPNTSTSGVGISVGGSQVAQFGYTGTLNLLVSGGNYFQFAGTPTGARVLTLPDRSANVATTSGALTSGHCAQYDASGNLTDAGAACGTGGGTTDLGTLTYNASGTTTFAAASATSAAGIVTVTHGTSSTLSPTGLVKWGKYLLEIRQDATGGGVTLTLGVAGTCTAWKVGGGGNGAITLSSAANAIDVLTFTYDGTNCVAPFQSNFN